MKKKQEAKEEAKKIIEHARKNNIPMKNKNNKKKS